MMCYLTHDRYAIGADVAPKPGEHDYVVEITRGSQTRETKITTVQGPSERWYVLDVQARPLCRTSVRSGSKSAGKRERDERSHALILP